jgi:hypothetical protein
MDIIFTPAGRTLVERGIESLKILDLPNPVKERIFIGMLQHLLSNAPNFNENTSTTYVRNQIVYYNNLLARPNRYTASINTVFVVGQPTLQNRIDTSLQLLLVPPITQAEATAAILAEQNAHIDNMVLGTPSEINIITKDRSFIDEPPLTNKIIHNIFASSYNVLEKIINRKELTLYYTLEIQRLDSYIPDVIEELRVAYANYEENKNFPNAELLRLEALQKTQNYIRLKLQINKNNIELTRLNEENNQLVINEAEPLIEDIEKLFIDKEYSEEELRAENWQPPPQSKYGFGRIVNMLIQKKTNEKYGYFSRSETKRSKTSIYI